jgi:DNA-binding NarL/FixJ family response regulator
MLVGNGDAVLTVPEVFIVEDDQLLARALSVQIECLGYSVSGMAHTADAAVQGVLEARPHIVIMDVNLEAGGNGLDAARLIRGQRDVPIIFYTAYNDAALRHEVGLLQNAQILEKPVPDEALNEALATASCTEPS